MKKLLTLISITFALSLITACGDKEPARAPLSQKELELALPLAAQTGDTEQVRNLIQQGADINKRNFEGQTSLMLAAKGNHTERT